VNDELDSQEKFTRGGNVVPGRDGVPRRYSRKPTNNASNDRHSGYQSARGGGDYSWGKTSPRFQNFGAEITPTGHNTTTRRKLARGGQTEDDFWLPPAQRRAELMSAITALLGAAPPR
jgi:hypothetical protein